MSAFTHTPRVPSLPLTLRGVLAEAAVVVVAGTLSGVLLNAISPRGINLGRDYFPRSPSPVTAGTDTHPPAETVRAPTPTNDVLARLRERGLQPLDKPTAVALFHASQRTPAAVLFVDVRNDTLYQAGHIPRARPFNYYRPEVYLADILAACANAQRIVVYCNGGDCEDSELAAGLLVQTGVPRERVFVYLGGYAEWTANDLPVETGGLPQGVQQGGPL